MNDPNRWSRVDQLFKIAIELESDTEIEAFLDRECGKDADLRNEVRSLLDHHENATTFLESPAFESDIFTPAIADHSEAARTTKIPELPPSSNFRIIKVLGEGGMGVVYRAEQLRPKRTVALKLIRPGIIGEGLLERFERESDLLARLEHPGIARIYESGTLELTGSRQPYFAMELVDGRPITEYVTGQCLDQKGRIQLLIQVMHAVHHAHQRGIIHRDLKPDNILVDASGEPRVLDFGVARNLEPSERNHTLATGLGQIIGTVPYMSPEQAAGRLEAVDVRSDVYALGVVAFEVLTERLPFDLNPRNLLDSVRTITDTPPAPLSRFDRACRGDLETIVLKALEKDVDRRYPTALHFASDLRRFLNDEPVEARPPSIVYQITKFARRHRILVGSAAAVFLILVAAMVTVSILLDRAIDAEAVAIQSTEEMKAARDDAQQEARNAQEITEFITGMLGTIDPAADGRDWRVLDMLETGRAEIAERFRDQPLREASIRNEFGTIYFALRMIDESREEFERALELRRNELGPTHAETLKCLNNLGMTYMNRNEADQAKMLLEQALAGRLEVLGPDAIETLRTRNNLGQTMVLLGDLDAGERFHRETLEALRRLHPESSNDILTSINNLVGILRGTGRTEEALGFLEDSLVQADAVWGPDHRRTLITRSSYASALKELERFNEAEPIYLDVIKRFQDHFGPQDRDTMIVEYNLGLMYVTQERFSEGEVLFGSLLDRARSVPPQDDRFLDRFLDRHIHCLIELGRRDEAEAEMIERYDAAVSMRGENSSRARQAAEKLAEFYLESGRTDDADAWRGRAKRESSPDGQ